MKLFVVVYSTKYGEDVYPYFQDQEPDPDDIKKDILKAVGEPFDEETEPVSIHGPYKVPESR